MTTIPSPPPAPAIPPVFHDLYEKRPVRIHAVRVTWETLPAIVSLARSRSTKCPRDVTLFLVLPSGSSRYTTNSAFEPHPDLVVSIYTLEGVVNAKHGDWLILGVKGELYPCRDDIFRETYHHCLKPDLVVDIPETRALLQGEYDRVRALVDRWVPEIWGEAGAMMIRTLQPDAYLAPVVPNRLESSSVDADSPLLDFLLAEGV